MRYTVHMPSMIKGGAAIRNLQDLYLQIYWLEIYMSSVCNAYRGAMREVAVKYEASTVRNQNNNMPIKLNTCI